VWPGRDESSNNSKNRTMYSFSSYIIIYYNDGMESDIQLLELADGIKDALVNTGFLTIKSILSSTTSDISCKVGVDPYIAQIIIQEGKRVATKMAARPNVFDASPTGNTIAVAIEKKEINLV
jgi:hypothetical protein